MITVDDHLSQIDSNAGPQSLVFRHVFARDGQLLVQGDGGYCRSAGGREYGQQAVTDCVDQLSSVVGNNGARVGKALFQRVEGRFFILLGQAGKFDDISM